MLSGAKHLHSMKASFYDRNSSLFKFRITEAGKREHHFTLIEDKPKMNYHKTTSYISLSWVDSLYPCP